MGLLGQIWDKAKSLIGKSKTIYGNISEGIGKVKDYTNHDGLIVYLESGEVFRLEKMRQ